tara:strand:+ start:1263 stop:1403 length:141 start_codon:yes stop_codon:yes gene_type:complete
LNFSEIDSKKWIKKRPGYKQSERRIKGGLKSHRSDYNNQMTPRRYG